MHKKLAVALGVLTLISGCGGGGSAAPEALALPTLTGQFIDGPVANVAYATTSGLRGSTDSNGNYLYKAGDRVTFSIGKIVLGEGTAGPTTTPLDLVGGAVALDHPEVVKILQLLQTLDSDGNPANGLVISSAVAERLAALPAEKMLKNITDLALEAIAPAYAAGVVPPVLKTAAAAKLHFAQSLAALEVKGQLAAMPGIRNYVMGGANKNCSSFNGDTKSANCAADWTTILAQDAAFAGLGKTNISFDSSYALPAFTYRLTGASIASVAAIPARLLDAGRKAALLVALNARLATGGAQTGLDFAAIDGSKPLFADGLAFWNNSSAADFATLLTAVCGAASPGNGADCTVSDTTIAAVNAAAFTTAADKPRVLLILRSLQSAFGNNAVLKFRNNADGSAAAINFRSEFRARVLAADGSAVVAGITASLTAAEKAVVRTALVEPNPQNNRKIEGRSVQFLTDPASLAMYAGFVAAARAANGGQTPTIGIVTASAETHPFADRDINFYALKSAGANVVYLPMDGGFRQALDAGDCANTRYYYDSYANTNASGNYFHSDQIFPDLAREQQAFCANGGATLNAALQSMSGIFFTGGDQARHLESFVSKDASGAYTASSVQLQILQARFAANKLVVAGTSAGNHVQGGGLWKGKPVPMIGGGDSYATLQNGFVAGSGPVPGADPRAISYARGGLGFFNFGVLDSHFSRRTREARLVRATRDGGMDYGFGVDENTALVVGQSDAAGTTQFSVVGDGGVFIADVRNASQPLQAGSSAGSYRIEGVVAHYLNPGDRFEINSSGALTVTLAATKPLLPGNATQARATQAKVQDYNSSNFLNLTKNMGLSGAAEGFGNTAGSADGRGNPQSAPVYTATLGRTASTTFRGLAGGRVSYTGVSLAFAPCVATGCAAF